MPSLQTTLRANDDEVAAKVMDGEAILINISTGMYHSMDKAGGLIWELIERGHSLQQIAEAVARRYEVEVPVAQKDVDALAEALLAENLVVETAGDAPPLSDVNGAPERLPYEAPRLNTYRDMSDLLALDPPMPGLQQLPEWENQ